METKLLEFLTQKIEIHENGKKTLFFKFQNNCDQSIKIVQMALFLKGENSKRLNYGFENLNIAPRETYEKTVPVNFSGKEKFEYEIIVTKIVCKNGAEWENDKLKFEKIGKLEKIDWEINKKKSLIIDSIPKHNHDNDHDYYQKHDQNHNHNHNQNREDAIVENQVNTFFDNMKNEAQIEEKVPLYRIKKQKIKQLGLIGMGIIVAILILVTIIHHHNKTKKYISALELISNNKWDEAYELFESIENYSDVEQYIKQIDIKEKVYKQALESTNRNEWEISAKLLMSISDYKNAEALYKENPIIVKEKAEHLAKSKNYDEAINLYNSIIKMKDNDLALESIKKRAEKDYIEYFKLIRSGDLAKVYDNYSNLNYKNSKIINAYIETKILYSQKIANKEPSEIESKTLKELDSLLVKIPDSYKGDLKDTVLGYKFELQSVIDKIKTQKP